jgi:hypothetical protein
LVDFVAAWAAGGSPAAPLGTNEQGTAALRSAVDDLKSLYLEAAAEQPRRRLPAPTELNRWLYHETRFGAALYDLRDRLAAAAAGDPQTRPVALVPNAFRDRPAAGQGQA